MIPFTFYLDKLSRHSNQQVVSSLVLDNGSQVSIQASKVHYSTPRRDLNSYAGYSQFEVGFASWQIPSHLIHKFNSLSDIHAYVDVSLIQEIINFNGGIVGYRKGSTVVSLPATEEDVTLWLLTVDTSSRLHV